MLPKCSPSFWIGSYAQNDSRLVADGALHQLSRHLGQIAVHYRQHFADPLGQNAAIFPGSMQHEDTNGRLSIVIILLIELGA